MKAARLHSYSEYLKIDEVAEPEIEGPLDVIVRIGAAGLCRTDLHLKDGDFREIHKQAGVGLPLTLGHENAGWVHEVGSAVTNVEVGDAVVVHPLITCGLCRACRAGKDMQCEEQAFPGLFVDGGFADLLKTHARSVIKLDPGLEPRDIAAHADAGLTAYHAVKKAKDILYPGTTAVVIGAGGLGHIAVQCLKALTPAEIVVVDKLEPALELAREIGADHTVLADGGEVDAVAELTDGKGAEAVIDIVAEQGVEKVAPQMVRDAGTYYVVGYGGALDVPTQAMILREISIVGNLVGTYNDLAELMTLAAQGKVTLHTSTYPLDAITDAMVDLERGNLRGRGILIPENAA
ncbi:MAG: NAD(P)-dependent alcohol dehydrogenase [Actinomycetota bacterium]|jgi:NAD+-dependent secondary alcohol dehydrogenase Adh1|nr:NAD(P)-dependent alcohol dehydrogenase [Actinomycetota bacterium]